MTAPAPAPAPAPADRAPTGDPRAAAVRLRVYGGAGGTEARLEDLESAGRGLQRAAGTVAVVAVRVAGIATDPQLAASGLASPVTWWHAEAGLGRALAGRSGAVAVAARSTALGSGALAAATVYRGAEASVAAAVHAADHAAGVAVGRLLGEPALVGAAVTATVLDAHGVELTGAGRLIDAVAA